MAPFVGTIPKGQLHTLRWHPDWQKRASVPLALLLARATTQQTLQWFGWQLLTSLTGVAEVVFGHRETAGGVVGALPLREPAVAQQQPGRRPKRVRLSFSAALARKKAKYQMVLRREMATEKQVSTAPDGSRVSHRERLCSPIMGLEKGFVGWLAPQARHGNQDKTQGIAHYA